MKRVTRSLRIRSDMKNLRIIENAVDEITNLLGIKQENYGKILVAVLEAVNNAITHGNKADLKKFVDVRIKVERNEMEITVTDEGEGFNPADIPDPTSPENIEEISGRGVFLMTRLADSILFNETGNSVTMKFREVTA
ncbi:MAG: ATP-binding protein [Bacteroidales bacterium]|jgi:serine/threonine-protein kinase RsbW|nr:ATP-binding protein [Bacteroidales bacterium]HPM87488.1 ATP-binding protein [Bacteroidales bacterium]